MTRTEAIAIIERALPDADDDALAKAAELLQAAAATASELPRAFSARELELIEQAKADFREGRTLSEEEFWTEVDTELAILGVPKSAP